MISIKRSDAFHNASMGTDFGSGAFFATPPNFPHGLNGIIISLTPLNLAQTAPYFSKLP